MVKKPPIQPMQEMGFSPWVGKIPWLRRWHPPPVFWPGESHGRRSLAVTAHGVTKSWMQLSDRANGDIQSRFTAAFFHRTVLERCWTDLANLFSVLYRIIWAHEYHILFIHSRIDRHLGFILFFHYSNWFWNGGINGFVHFQHYKKLPDGSLKLAS